MSSSHAAWGCSLETRRVIFGRPRTRVIAATAARTGSPARSGSCGPSAIPSRSSRPASARVSTLIALVKKNRPLERCTIWRADMPARWSSQPPTASEPTPPPGRSAPDPICDHAISRAAVLGIGSKNSRKMTTKLRQDASSRATAAATSVGFMSAISPATGRRSGTASTTVTTQTASTTTVSTRCRRRRCSIAARGRRRGVGTRSRASNPLAPRAGEASGGASGVADMTEPLQRPMPSAGVRRGRERPARRLTRNLRRESRS
jgi:hypothetical protein